MINFITVIGGKNSVLPFWTTRVSSFRLVSLMLSNPFRLLLRFPSLRLLFRSSLRDSLKLSRRLKYPLSSLKNSLSKSGSLKKSDSRVSSSSRLWNVNVWAGKESKLMQLVFNSSAVCSYRSILATVTRAITMETEWEKVDPNYLVVQLKSDVRSFSAQSNLRVLPIWIWSGIGHRCVQDETF